ncbi:Uncharacterised protein [Mycobacteroides abscessus subsp. abscessus]|nr:Uncharacterised protein [Mycobacteroides abscessus subsp. abscessus]
MPPFFCGPLAHPCPPGTVTSEPCGDFSVIRRQVVLGEQVDHQGRLGDGIQGAVLRFPVLTPEEGEVPAPTPGHVIVWGPRPCGTQMPFEVFLDNGLQFGE